MYTVLSKYQDRSEFDIKSAIGRAIKNNMKDHYFKIQDMSGSTLKPVAESFVQAIVKTERHIISVPIAHRVTKHQLYDVDNKPDTIRARGITATESRFIMHKTSAICRLGLSDYATYNALFDIYSKFILM